MRVLVVNGFPGPDPAPVVAAVGGRLEAAGHEVERFDLAANGFDAFMSAAEREAYHTETPLIMDETRRAADAVLATSALVICYPIVHGSAPARVKSWQERVFVLGLAFRFKPSGKITGALDHLQRTLVIGVADPDDPAVSGPAKLRASTAGRRNAFGPCLARSFVLSSNRRCRARYLTCKAENAPDRVGRLASRW